MNKQGDNMLHRTILLTGAIIYSGTLLAQATLEKPTAQSGELISTLISIIPQPNNDDSIQAVVRIENTGTEPVSIFMKEALFTFDNGTGCTGKDAVGIGDTRDNNGSGAISYLQNGEIMQFALSAKCDLKLSTNGNNTGSLSFTLKGEDDYFARFSFFDHPFPYPQ